MRDRPSMNQNVIQKSGKCKSGKCNSISETSAN